MAEITNHRRYCFLQYRLNVRLDDDLEDTWDNKRRAIPGTALPVGFPALGLLLTAGYLVTEELNGADETELKAAGLTSSQAAAVLAAIG